MEEVISKKGGLVPSRFRYAIWYIPVPVPVENIFYIIRLLEYIINYIELMK